MKIYLGDKYDILYTGTVVVVDNESINFEFPPENVSLKINLLFTSKEGRKPGFESRAISDKTLELQLINFDSQHGIGNTTPLEIGYMGNRNLYLNLRVFSSGSLGRLLHYTFLLGKESQVGTI